MARLGRSEQREFESLRSLCYTGRDSTELRQRVGDRVARVIGADAFCLMEIEPSVMLPTDSVAEGWPAEAQDALIEEVILNSPVADVAAIHRLRLRTVAADDLAGGLDDPYFASLLLPFGYRYELLTLCTLGGRPVALLTFARRAGRGDFDRRERRFLDALAPHVGAGIRRSILRAATLADADAATGIIVLAADGRVEFANRAAERWLRRSSGRSGMWYMALRLMVALAARPAADAVTPATLQTRHPDSGVLHRLHAERTLDGDGSARTVVLIEPVRAADRPEVLAQLGLTAREADVAIQLLRGLDTSEIAVAIGCAPQTVRVHMTRMFEKLGVRSRRQLAALLMGSGQRFR